MNNIQHMILPIRKWCGTRHSPRFLPVLKFYNSMRQVKCLTLFNNSASESMKNNFPH